MSTTNKIAQTSDLSAPSKRKSLGRSPWFRVLRLILLIYLGLTGVVWAFQRNYIYYPHREDVEILTQSAREMGMEPWNSAKGERIGWKKTDLPGAGNLIVFHGNAGHALHRSHYLYLFSELQEVGFSGIYLFEYPGYGSREGRPSESAFYRTAKEGMESVRTHSSEPLYLLGESLGSGVACHLASLQPEAIAGILLITPFDRLTSVGQHHFPFLPVRLLLRDRYDNIDKLPDFNGPVAIVLAGKDEVVPLHLGEKLYNAYTGPKELWVLENANHNTLLQATGSAFWREVLLFLKEG